MRRLFVLGVLLLLMRGLALLQEDADIAGSGDPLLLIHGSGPGVSAFANWRLVIGPLAERFRVLAPDMAGFGSSDKPDQYGMNQWVEQLVAFCDVLELGRISIVGNSFGGALALALAIRRVTKLTHRPAPAARGRRRSSG